MLIDEKIHQVVNFLYPSESMSKTVTVQYSTVQVHLRTASAALIIPPLRTSLRPSAANDTVIELVLGVVSGAQRDAPPPVRALR